ncbi:MAG TPA: PEP-CTERM/exosortase system-associated acyltransferase [Nitrosomonas europaea]|uniref:PEP-CTERM/exosortase system-associated acyltransferase n=1 Tax=Nitrosomonas europaea TaxID=915 RepID=UPI0024926FFB|nr:PEP-CTERM/exosortase system-associated acyltransferase [Nitrosomonas europaea]HRO55647.1 PEP-CTERM/exosortase system-associated acyltransferase [Nitrosomonas europaea]HUM72856.1 PEP-CTERM/exosortase system-associated acyltransferase [Nitrosomonas europaea]
MFTQENSHLGTSFRQYFKIVPALTEELKREAYRVRHSVYCEDLQFESSRSDGFEIDEYDAHSLHLLIRSINNDTFIGCTRIIRPSSNSNDRRLPFEKTCAQTLDRSIIDPSRLPADKIGEVSRLAVIAAFRRRKGEKNHPINISEEDFSTGPMMRFPYIPLGLYIGTIELARIHDIRVLFMLTEERLASHFSRLGAQLEPIGAPVEHRGLRFPSMVEINSIISNMRPIFRPLYQAIAEDIKAELEKKNH